MKTTISTAFLFFAVQALACSVPIATTTFYYTPDAKVICGKYYSKNEKPCAKFITDANMQGSGIQSPGILYRYKQSLRELGSGCKTTFGYAGKCLIPYVSIAVDPNYHNMGDYISMPAMKGKKVTLADGRVLSHPGYFRVDDTGGAIDGRTRFDFYTGSLGLGQKKNSFSESSESGFSMETKKPCSPRKTYENVKSSQEKALAKAAIANFEKAVNGGVQAAGNMISPVMKKTNKKTGGGQN
jgi:3D (Asp-Asp-Asp) domain-containing protein